MLGNKDKYLDAVLGNIGKFVHVSIFLLVNKCKFVNVYIFVAVNPNVYMFLKFKLENSQTLKL